MLDKNGIRIIYGDNPKQMVKELLERSHPKFCINGNSHSDDNRSDTRSP